VYGLCAGGWSRCERVRRCNGLVTEAAGRIAAPSLDHDIITALQAQHIACAQHMIASHAGQCDPCTALGQPDLGGGWRPQAQGAIFWQVERTCGVAWVVLV
jgi:hypothetical protein